MWQWKEGRQIVGEAAHALGHRSLGLVFEIKALGVDAYQ